MYIKRALEDVVRSRLFGGKVIVLYGARQTGKTTMIQHILKDHDPRDVRYIDCELLSNRTLLGARDEIVLFSLVAGYRIVVFDEAQGVRGIGSVVKSIHDHHPQVQIIVTGSSSFDLANELSEPLTGRSVELTLYPLGVGELARDSGEAIGVLTNLMRFGGYPGIVELDELEQERALDSLVTQYLYKNVLAYEGVRKSEVVVQLVQLLAHQIGSEVSYSELSARLGVSVATVQAYIQLLEQNFVVFRLGAHSGNMRREVVRSRKIYFCDLGLRNALVHNFRPPTASERADCGALFENCMIAERRKHIMHAGGFGLQQMFWRTTTGSEIDYIEQWRGNMSAYEFKLNPTARMRGTRAFSHAYPDIAIQTVSPITGYGFVQQA